MSKNTNMIPIEEENRVAKKYKENLEWANSLTTEQIDFLCDIGRYDDTIRGYLITAARKARFNDDQIKDLLDGLYRSFSEKSKYEAEQAYLEFMFESSYSEDEERLHGKWSNKMVSYKCNSVGFQNDDLHFGYQCSICGAVLNKTRYCGNCGAEMSDG